VGPGLKPAIENHLVLNIDMAPTILELAGMKPAENMHGKSMVPLLNGNSKDWRKSFIYEGLGTYGGAKPNLTVVSENYRYIQTYKDETLDEVIFTELYHQDKDPLEIINLANRNLNQDLMNEFQQTIREHKKQILKD
jgi:arylsulfatase A-like enzyme